MAAQLNIQRQRDQPANTESLQLSVFFLLLLFVLVFFLWCVACLHRRTLGSQQPLCCDRARACARLVHLPFACIIGVVGASPATSKSNPIEICIVCVCVCTVRSRVCVCEHSMRSVLAVGRVGCVRSQDQPNCFLRTLNPVGATRDALRARGGQQTQTHKTQHECVRVRGCSSNTVEHRAAQQCLRCCGAVLARPTIHVHSRARQNTFIRMQHTLAVYKYANHSVRGTASSV